MLAGDIAVVDRLDRPAFVFLDAAALLHPFDARRASGPARRRSRRRRRCRGRWCRRPAAAARSRARLERDLAHGTRRSGAASGSHRSCARPASGPVVTFGVTRSDSEMWLVHWFAPVPGAMLAEIAEEAEDGAEREPDRAADRPVPRLVASTARPNFIDLLRAERCGPRRRRSRASRGCVMSTGQSATQTLWVSTIARPAAMRRACRPDRSARGCCRNSSATAERIAR